MNRYQLTERVAILGILINILLLISKLIVGFGARSQAMIADGFNSAGDVFASIMTYAGNRIASRPQDRDHPYGHGKAEYVFSMVISFSLFLVAYKIFTDSLGAILERAEFKFSWWLFGVGLATILLKAGLFLYTSNIGKRLDNLLILANSEDHRNDVFITSSTLMGIALGVWGVYWLDGLIGIGISFWIAYTSFRIFIKAYHVLMDTNIDHMLKIDITKAIESIDGVLHVDEITAVPIGASYIIIVKASVRGDRTVSEGHSIAARIKKKLKECSRVGDVVVHINPDYTFSDK